MLKYILALVVFVVLATMSAIGIVVLKRQKAICVESRLGASSSVSELINVNIGLLLVALLVWFREYLLIPPVLMYIIFIMISTRIRSGLSEEGAFIGLTFLDWKHMEGYKFVNDSLNTFKVKLRANHRQYVLECDKEYRPQVEKLVRMHLQETPQ